LYLSDEERNSIQAKARNAALPLSSFIRRCALSQHIAAAPSIAAEQWAKLAGLAANLNQIARHLNNGNQLSAYDMVIVDKMRLHLDAIRMALTGDIHDRKNR